MISPENPQAESGTGTSGQPFNWRILVLLTLIYVCLSYDRAIVSVIQEPIKHEFKLSDLQIGLVTGVAYSSMTVLFSLPMGLLIDRWNRRNLLGFLMVAWSVTTALGGLARGFWSLMASRMAVGASEAGGYPLLVSLAADLVPPRRHATIIGIVMAGTPLGTIAAMALGGWTGQEFGWRTAFFIAGIPGFILAVLLYVLLKEPKRTGVGSEQQRDRPRLGEVLRFVGTQRAMLFTMAAACLSSFIMAGYWAWVVSFMVRVHHMTIADGGFSLAMTAGLATVVGAVTTGYVADRLGGNDNRRRLFLLAAQALISIPIGFAALQTDSIPLTLALLACFNIVAAGYAALTTALTLSLARSEMRGTCVSLLNLLHNLIGAALGPLAVGALSDAIGGPVSLRHALSAVLVLFLFCAALYLAAARTIQADMLKIRNLEQAS